MPDHRYAVSNFREMLSILESLRVSVLPGKGMRHFGARPVVLRALRATEAPLVTRAQQGEFPILLQLAETGDAGLQPSLERTLPLSAVERVFFRQASDRDILLNRTFENASPRGLNLEVDESLFGQEGEPRFLPLDEIPSEEPASWRQADWICGGLAAALAAARLHPRLPSPEHWLLTSGFGRDLVDLLDQSAARDQPAGALVDLLARESGRGDLYGETLLEMALDVLDEVGSNRDILDAFAKHVRAVLASDVARKPGELTDEGDIALRALSLLIQRPTTADVLEDRVNGEFPGLCVFLTAALLSGVREGLARLPWQLKSTEAEVISGLGAAIENASGKPGSIASLIGMPGLPAGSAPDDPADEMKAPAAGSRVLSLEICALNARSIAARALMAIADCPANWRIVCDDTGMLHLRILLDPAEDGATIEEQASLAVRSWMKRSRKTASKPSRSPDAPQADMLPGLGLPEA